MNLYKQLLLRRGFELQNRLYHLECATTEGMQAHLETQESFRFEWLNVLELCQWCSDNWATDTSAAVLLSKLIGVAGNLFFLFLPVHEQMYWREQAYLASRRAELSHDELGHGAQLAYLYVAVGNVERAHELLDELFDRNKKLVESPGDARLLGQASYVRAPEERQGVHAALLSHRGMFLTASGRYEEALPVLQEAITEFRIHKDPGLAKCLNSLANVQGHLDQNKDALRTIDEVIDLVGKGSSASALINRGSYLGVFDRHDEALESIMEGHRNAVVSGDDNAIALASFHLGSWYIRHGDENKRSGAIDYFVRAVKLYRKTGAKL